jgi:hypothetical protein
MHYVNLPHNFSCNIVIYKEITIVINSTDRDIGYYCPTGVSARSMGSDYSKDGPPPASPPQEKKRGFREKS